MKMTAEQMIEWINERMAEISPDCEEYEGLEDLLRILETTELSEDDLTAIGQTL